MYIFFFLKKKKKKKKKKEKEKIRIIKNLHIKINFLDAFFYIFFFWLNIF